MVLSLRIENMEEKNRIEMKIRSQWGGGRILSRLSFLFLQNG